MGVFAPFLRGESHLRFDSLPELNDFMRRCDTMGIGYGSAEYMTSCFEHYMLNPSPTASPVVGFSPISGHIYLAFAGFNDPGVATYAMQKKGFIYRI